MNGFGLGLCWDGGLDGALHPRRSRPVSNTVGAGGSLLGVWRALLLVGAAAFGVRPGALDGGRILCARALSMGLLGSSWLWPGSGSSLAPATLGCYVVLLLSRWSSVVRLGWALLVVRGVPFLGLAGLAPLMGSGLTGTC